MATIRVQQKPLQGTARQFDGSLSSVTDIIGVRSRANLSVTITYDAAGALTGLALSNAAGMSVVLTVGDYVVFPDAVSAVPFVVDAGHATSDWTVL